MKRTKKSTETAAQAMARANSEALVLIERIKEHVLQNQIRFEQTGRKDWGFVGNMAEVNELMHRILGEDRNGVKEV